jgi:hypothetical protein
MPDYALIIGCMQQCIVAFIAWVRQQWVALYRSTAQRDDLKVERKENDLGLVTP